MADTFKPGDKVDRSGIYRVVHDQHHAQEHEVTASSQSTFLHAITVDITCVSS